MFVLGTVVPSISILGGWWLFRNSSLWLRALVTALALFGSPLLGFGLVMESIEQSRPGAGVAAVPMVLLWFGAMLVTLIAEGARVWGRNRGAKRQP
jgi:hypothetical protein